MSTLRILLTGATGFTGRAVYKRLLTSGYEVFLLVRAKRGLGNELLWDFSGPLPAGMPTCAAVVHLAAYVDFSDIFQLEQFQINTVSTMRLAAYAREKGAYFLFASMVGVHGNCAVIDSDTPLNPQSNYGLSKYLGEQAITALVNDYCIMRIGGIYGLDGPGHLGLNRAISSAYHQEIIPQLHGPGQAKRNYVCVEDVADWILAVLNRVQEKSAQGGEIIYVAGPEVMTIENYLQTIVDVFFSGRKLTRLNGNESLDSIVMLSQPPIPLTTYGDYLRILKQKRLAEGLNQAMQSFPC